MRNAHQVPSFCQWRLLRNSILTAVLLACLRLGRPCNKANLHVDAFLDPIHICTRYNYTKSRCGWLQIGG